jgi:maltose alpha-D-glucosyltransferase/alpha-amylase
MSLSLADTAWFRYAIFYSLDVETFRDSDGDGVGDIVGVIQSLDYLSNLGVNLLWLRPFYPSPDHDDGYDVSDFYGVEPRFGSLGDYVELVRQAGARGIRVLVDLVMQHSSDEHPWFQAAVADPSSKFREYYVWRDEPPPNPDPAVLFEEGERNQTIWTRNDSVGAYYRHRFYDFEPDLNPLNPAVRQEILKVMGYWLQLGTAGFRVDALPFMVDTTGMDVELDDPHAFIREMRSFLNRRDPTGVFLAEADDSIEHGRTFFGNGDQMQMIFNFVLAANVFLGLVKREAQPILDICEQSTTLPLGCSWATFLRNHDELNLAALSDEDQQMLLNALAPQEEMRLYGRGVRRRMATLLGGDRRRIELAFSILLTLPGVPVIYYGDEIGMGDNLGLHDRASVRTPMQWSGAANAGFSSAPSDQLVVPVINRGAYRYRQVNVQDELRDPNSLLNWLSRAIRRRREQPAIGNGQWRAVKADKPEVLAYGYEWQSRRLVAVHNLSDKPVAVNLELPATDRRRMIPTFGNDDADLHWRGQALELDGYGYRWIELPPSA